MRGRGSCPPAPFLPAARPPRPPRPFAAFAIRKTATGAVPAGRDLGWTKGARRPRGPSGPLRPDVTERLTPCQEPPAPRAPNSA
ncbi:hypothetical protein GCM10010495_38100 [Kitasatospora herbaricolor]|nr:hypothetical protein GCM10010495_38100 [Kitasatospora herbaricolor]